MRLLLLLVSLLVLYKQEIVAKYTEDENYYDVTLVDATTTPIDYDIVPTSSENIIAPSDSDSNIIELNIGGQRITTSRDTLTAVPESKLALMFSKKRKNQTMPIDKNGAIFFDYNPVHFMHLINQLRRIKRLPKKPAHEIQYQNSFIGNESTDFNQMIIDLGLNANGFLSPLTGIHANLKANSLIGWKECYRDTYDHAFDPSLLTKVCNSSRFLVACRPVNDTKKLTVAAVGRRDELLQPCSLSQCSPQGNSGVTWYLVANSSWGFARGAYSSHNMYGSYRANQYDSYNANRCDQNDADSEYRLCWSLRSDATRGGGDRCGNNKNLHNSIAWERLVYRIEYNLANNF